MRAACTLFATLLLLSSTAAAKPVGFHKHDGFYLRLAGGLGYMYSSTSEDSADVSIKGMSALTSLGVGFAISENFILNADIFGGQAMDPKMKMSYEGQSMEGKLDGDVMAYGLGGGFTYYSMPSNAYVAASVGMAWLSAKIDGADTGRSDTGLGLDVLIGKEWWVSDNWGLGLAGQFIYVRVKDSGMTWNSLLGGLLFSATFN